MLEPWIETGAPGALIEAWNGLDERRSGRTR